VSSWNIFQTHRSKEDFLMAKTLIAFLTGNLILPGKEAKHLSGRRRFSAKGHPQLEGEDANRRAAIRELRLEEAREYLDLLLGARQMLRQVQTALSKPSRLDKQARTLEEVASLLDIAGRKRYRIESLDDARLIELDERLRDALCEVHGHLSQFTRLAQKQGSIHADVIRGMTVEKNNEISALISHMQSRLHELRGTE
jgi:hypothetical protein